MRYTAIRQLEVKTKWIFILITTSSPFPFIFFFQTFKILQLIFCFPEISLESLGNYISIIPRQRLCELTDQRVLGFSQSTGGPETGETSLSVPFSGDSYHSPPQNQGQPCLVNHSYSLVHFKKSKRIFFRKKMFPCLNVSISYFFQICKITKR